MKKIELYDFTALRCPLVQSKKLGLEKIFSMVLHSTSVPQLQLLLGDTFSLLRIRVKFEAIFIALLFPWTSFCFPEFLTLNVFLFPGFLIYVHQSRIYVPRCLIYFLESHIHFPELFIELLERFGFRARCPEFMISCSPYLFLASFIYIRKFIISFPKSTYLLSVFSMLIFPNSFFPYPRASFKVLNFSAYFPAFRQLLYFLVYFDRFAFICLFLWILICFSESEPLVFSSLAKTHKVVKLKRRPQWWPNAFVGNVNWREALKHICITYLPSSRAAVSFVHLLLLWLLAIIEGGGFT